MPCSDCGLSFICAGGRSPSDISNAAETRCDKGELSDAGIDIEPTPALVFLSYLSRTLSLLGNFKLVLHTSLTSRRTQNLIFLNILRLNRFRHKEFLM